MKLSRTVGYALQAVLQLAEAEPDTPIPCSRLAAQGRMPERFLLQILRNLVNNGILHSTRGVDGGYMLTRSSDDISLLQLIEAADGPVNAKPPAVQGLPAESLEKLNVALQDVCNAARRQLSVIKLSSLLPRRRKSPDAPEFIKRRSEGANVGS
jgi:Rrf2 family protein